MNGADRATLLESGCPDREVKAKVLRALEAFIGADRDLLRADASERALAHRLACHLSSEFSDWHVDCEYNRVRFVPKRLATFRNGGSVYPDIAVHQRLTDRNHLVIEIKKSTNPGGKEEDLEKLRAYREELGYSFGLFLLFEVGSAEADLAEAVWA